MRLLMRAESNLGLVPGDRPGVREPDQLACQSAVLLSGPVDLDRKVEIGSLKRARVHKTLSMNYL
jgi:hypothetical protein